LEDGCGKRLNETVIEVTVPVRIVISGTDAESCKKRRLNRVAILKAKRHRCEVSCNSSVASSSGSSVSARSTYTLTKDELRRKKNRESAERSRVRKLAHIDFLASQATTLQGTLDGLAARNQLLRTRGAAAEGSVAGGRVDSCASYSQDESDCHSDVSTISGASSPCRCPSPSPASLPGLFAGKTHSAHCKVYDPLAQWQSAPSSSSAKNTFPDDTHQQSSSDTSMASTTPSADFRGDASTDLSGAWSAQHDLEFDMDGLLDFDFPQDLFAAI
jgi:hypothetical protein